MVPSRFRGVLAALSATIAMATLASPAAAHPHVWMTVTVAPTFDADGRFASVHEKWFFDYDYSLLIGSQLDADGDGQFSVDELVATISPGGLLGWIGEKNWLTLLTVGGQQIPRGAVSNISVGVVESRLTVEFTLALPEPQPVKLGAEVDVFDPEVYYDVQFDRPDIEAPTAPASCTVAARPKDELDPFAVMMIKRLGLPSDPKVLNDPAVGFTVRVMLNCA
jgi:ABC-type uncharacterized transport system substrate-binding protein